MIVTLTSKGQLTLPKAIREQMKLDAGSKLDFQLAQDGTLTARPMRSVTSLIGLVKPAPGTKQATLQDLKEARGRYAAEKFDRVSRQTAERAPKPKR